MLITDWWSQNGPFASWLPAEMRAELLECSGDNIQSLPDDLRALLEVFSVFQSADYQKTISMLDSHLFSGRAEMLLPVIRARICAQTGDYASAVRELQFAEKLGFHSGLVSYTSRVLLGMQVDSHGSAAQLGGSWEEILGDSIHSLPTDLQTLCLRSAHSPGLRMTGQHISLLCICLDIIQEEYAFALDAIEHRYPKSDYKGSLFLLRARVLAELSRFDEMLLCLQGAAELCGGDDSFQTTFNELSNRMLTHTRPDGISLQLKRGLAITDFRSMPIGSARIRENESRTNQIASDKGSCLVQENSPYGYKQLGRSKIKAALIKYAGSALHQSSISSIEECIEIKIINLKHRTDRWAGIKEHLDELGFEAIDDYRFEAVGVEGFGELGCTRSHLMALTEYMCRSEKPYLMILEDDFRFKANAHELTEVLNWFMGESQGDVLMMNCSCAMLAPDGCSHGKYTVSRVISSNSMAGFVIKRSHVRELIGALLDSLRSHESVGHIYKHLKSQGRRESFRPILNMICNDRIWVSLQTSHRYLTVTPSVGSTVESYSDIESRHVNYRHMEVQ